MERDKLLAELRALSDRGHGAAGFKPIFVIEQEILAEFDQLKALAYADNGVSYKELAFSLLKERDEAQGENERLKEELKKADNRCAEPSYCGEKWREDAGILAQNIYRLEQKRDTLQSWLGRISEPFSSGRLNTERLLQSLRENCYMSDVTDIVKAIADYLGSQKPSKKPNHVHSDDSGIFWEGKTEDCPICNPKCEHKNGGISYYREGALKQWCGDCKEWVVFPKSKPLTQCPECKGAMKYQRKQSAYDDYEDFYIYYVLDNCPTCSGQGVIPE